MESNKLIAEPKFAHELRIGNYYEYLHEEHSTYHKADANFIQIQFDYETDPNQDKFSRGWWAVPIVLTPEILLKAGFEFKGESDYYMIYLGPNNLHISMAKSDIPFGFNDKKGCWYMGDNHTEIPNLHWLQNFVYFAYNSELTINL